MLNKILKAIEFILFFSVFLFLVNIVSAEVFTRFVTSGTFGSQTNEGTLFSCDLSTSSTYNNAFYDYFTVDNIELPSVDNLVSIDYCIQGYGNLNVGFNTEHFSSFVGDGTEQCYNASKIDYPNIYENIWLNNGYGLFGGSLNTDSSTDCLYVKINTITPTPTNTPTPTPTSTPTPTNTPTATPTNTPIPTVTPLPSETPTPTTAPTTAATVSSPSNNEASTSIYTPICNEQKPGSAPELLLATSSGPNSITLNWIKAGDPVSYYLVTFGTKSGEQLYGNPNVGDSNTTSYTINNLSGGQNYYFKVRAGNGCMPGDFSNEVIGRLTGGPVVGVPEGFAPSVLGESTKVSIKKDQIKTAVTNNFPKYIFLIIILVILGGVNLLFRKKLMKR